MNNIIIGAGPAGMFTANEMRKNNVPVTVIEKKENIGGLAATFTFNDCKYEVGPHILFTQDEYIKHIATELLQDDLIQKDWNVAQYVEGRLLKFPNSIGNMIMKLGLSRMIKFFLSYLTHSGKPYNDYQSFIYSKVGKELAHFSVINYTEKMWGVSLNELETEWIKPRLDRFSIKEIIKNTINPKERSFLYPRYGSGQLYDLMSEGLDIRTQEHPIKISHDGERIQRLTTNNDSYDVNQLISSIPLEELLNCLEPLPPIEVLKAASALIYRSQIYVILSFDQDQIIDQQWIYFNDHNVPFCRIHEPKNFSDINSTPDKSLLVVEYFCFYGDERWSSTDNEICNLTIEHLSKFGVVDSNELLASHVIRQKKAYPVLNNQRQKHLKTINTYIKEIQNLHNIGRHGLHTYDNQDQAGRAGINLINNIYDL